MLWSAFSLYLFLLMLGVRVVKEGCYQPQGPLPQGPEKSGPLQSQSNSG